MDRRQVKAGDFLVSGPPAVGSNLTKVFACESVADLDTADREFNAMQQAIELARRTKAALEALSGGPKP
jgi:hypothetical protein